MNRETRSLILLISIAVVITAGVIVENVHSVMNPENIEVTIDINKTKSEIERSGLRPREAMYWKEL